MFFSGTPRARALDGGGGANGHSRRGAHSQFQARQFEYHPSLPIMGVGTCDGEVLVIDWEKNELLQSSQFAGGKKQSILALSWLHKDPTKLITGSSNGKAAMYQTLLGGEEPELKVVQEYGALTKEMTSIHCNCEDRWLVASGYTKDVKVFDIETGVTQRVFENIHEDHINISRFANHLPNILLTCSFDNTIKLWDNRNHRQTPLFTLSSKSGNVMVSFSPNDMFFLASAVDNEVKQYHTVDGSLHLKYDIEPTGSSINYTRSYYSNGGDTIVSGSSNSDEVFLCCASTGQVLETIPIYEGRRAPDLYIQSLRGNPLENNRFCVLVFYRYSEVPYELVDINLNRDADGNWQEFPLSTEAALQLSQDLKTQLSSTRFSDVLLRTSDKHVITAHRVMLDARWGWFREHCPVQPSDGSNAVATVPCASSPGDSDIITVQADGVVTVHFASVTRALLVVLLEFLYTGKISLDTPKGSPIEMEEEDQSEDGDWSPLDSESSASTSRVPPRTASSEYLEPIRPRASPSWAQDLVLGESSPPPSNMVLPPAAEEALGLDFDLDSDNNDDSDDDYSEPSSLMRSSIVSGVSGVEEMVSAATAAAAEGRQNKSETRLASMLYRVATGYSLPRLRQILELFFRSNLTLTNALQTYHFALEAKAESLTAHCKDYVTRYYEWFNKKYTREQFERFLGAEELHALEAAFTPQEEQYEANEGVAGRMGHTLCAQGDLLYCLGGYNLTRTQSLGCIPIFNTSIYSWSFLPTYGHSPHTMCFHTASIVKNRIIAFGGVLANGGLDEVRVLDIKDMAWSRPRTRGNIPHARKRHTATAIGDNIWVFGGRARHQVFSDLYALHVPSLTWIRMDRHEGVLPLPRYGHTTTFVPSRNIIVVIGGYGPPIHNSLAGIADVYTLEVGALVQESDSEQQPSSSSKKTLPTMGVARWALKTHPPSMHFVENQPPEQPASRFCHSATLVRVRGREYIAVYGGSAGIQFNNYLKDLWLLSLDDWTWSQPELQGEGPSFRFTHSSFVLNPHEQADSSVMAIWAGADEADFPSEMTQLDLATMTWSPRHTRLVGRQPEPMLNSNATTLMKDLSAAFSRAVGNGEGSDPIGLVSKELRQLDVVGARPGSLGGGVKGGQTGGAAFTNGGRAPARLPTVYQEMDGLESEEAYEEGKKEQERQEEQEEQEQEQEEEQEEHKEGDEDETKEADDGKPSPLHLKLPVSPPMARRSMSMSFSQSPHDRRPYSLFPPQKSRRGASGISTGSVASALSTSSSLVFSPANSPDVTFIVEGRRIRVSKVLLAARSPHFRAMFRSFMVEATAKEIVIEDVRFATFRLMMRFVYCGAIDPRSLKDPAECMSGANSAAVSPREYLGPENFGDERVEPYELIVAADRFRLDSLSSVLQLMLSRQINEASVMQLLTFAEYFHLDALRDRCTMFVTTHYQDCGQDLSGISSETRESIETSRRLLVRPPAAAVQVQQQVQEAPKRSA